MRTDLLSPAIGKILLGIFLGYIGIAMVAKGATAPALVTNFDEAALPAGGGEKLRDGSVAKKGELIKPARDNIDGLGNIVVGLLFIAGGIYQVYGGAARLRPVTPDRTEH